MSVGQLARHRSTSSGSRPYPRSATPSDVIDVYPELEFRPCAATSSTFLFAQGSRILCLHHDSLAVERRFEKHRAPVTLLSVDNISERGAGRLVASYDVERVAIIWDLFSGDELSRFSSYKSIQVAAWMKNGNVAFGNDHGEVIIFEPSTKEHESARTIYDPITTIAPGADCQTFAIGYKNGSILIASLLPSFTILHTLSTSVAPSPIIGLAWHASSSKQRSDMLAVQMASGDLRVWSIAKPAGADVPKAIRNLERGDTIGPGLNWIAWSKNGRIIQFSQGETWAWDVRNKHVAYEPIPTVEGITGIANHGPTAVLFTLGPNNTVQQYSLSPPALVKNVRHDPSASTSLNTTPKLAQKTIPGAAPPVPVYMSYESSRVPASLSTIQKVSDMQAAEHARQLRAGMGSPLSTTSRTESIDSRSIDSMSSAGFRDRAPSVTSHAASGTTFSTVSPSYIARESAASPFWPQTASVASSGRRSKSSRLRHEVLRSPEGNLVDLFPYTRARLASQPYAPQNSALDQNTASATDLRRQMLRVVFGWDGDIEEMIRDELARHPPGSMNATLLAKWLGEMSLDLTSMMGSDSVTSTDWMMLALSSMGGQGEVAKQIGRNFTQKLLQQGDIHTAATVLLGMKDLDDAVDVYISRNYFMEGILLTCLLSPDDWQKQANLVRRWGEYVVENSQQHLAIRCFSCTGTDTSVPWASPTQSPFTGSHPPPGAPQTLSPPTSPPPNEKPVVTRMTPKTSSLKLITSFPPNEKDGFRFPGLKTDDRTPTNAPGITPIAESALSPGGTPSSYLRPPLRAKPPAGHGKHRLPSIGETPIDVNPPLLPVIRPDSLPTPDNSGSEKEKEPKLSIITTPDPDKDIEAAPLTLSSAKYDPKEAVTPKNQTPQTAVPTTALRTNLLSNSDVHAISHAQDKSRTRNGSRDRKPTGLHIQMPTLEQLNLNAVATGSDGKTPISGRRKSNSSSLHSGSSRDAKGDLVSPPYTGQSWTSSTKSPSVSSRDPYISSLEEAQYHAQKQKVRSHRSREGRLGEHKSRSKGRHRQPSEERDRGRSGNRYIKPAKRSPSSPVPMSPEDLQRYRDQHSQSLDSMVPRDSSPETGPRVSSTRRKAVSKNRSHSKISDHSHVSHITARRASPSGLEPDSRFGSRRASPDRLLTPIDGRGRSRSKNRGGSALRSPSSPLPMSPQAKLYQSAPDDYIESDPMKLVEQNRQRLRSRQRSSSRRPRERGTSSRRDPSPDRRRMPEDRPPFHSDSSRRDSPKTSDFEKTASDGVSEPGLKRTKSHRSLKKEMAARELEARRESLHARTMGAAALPPSQARPVPPSRTQSDFTNTASNTGEWKGMTSPESTHSAHSFSSASVSSTDYPPDRAASVGPFGLPATPRAMRHPRYPSKDDNVPAVPALPEMPDQFYATGHPVQELPRSISAPVPEPESAVPTDMPTHPAFQRGVRPSTRRPNFAPLDSIGKTRQRSPSIDANSSSMVLASIGETLNGVSESPVIDVPEPANASPGVIPELQHLASPPPPPPPPPPPFGQDMAHHSLSSGSGVGTINIVMDEGSRSGTPVIEVVSGNGGEIPPPPPAKDSVNSPPLPPLPLSAGKYSPPHSGNSTNGAVPTGNPPLPPSNGTTPSSENAPSSRGHRRGRSIDQFGNKIARMTERMRSTSRGRNNAKSPKPVEILKPSPYETRLEGQTNGYF